MLPPIDSSLIPADVRAAGARGMQVYTAALGFEQSLVQQLTQQLAQSAQPQDSGDSGDAASDVYTSMLPDAMSQGISASGGIGLADELFRTLTLGQAPAGDAGASGASA